MTRCTKRRTSLAGTSVEHSFCQLRKNTKKNPSFNCLMAEQTRCFLRTENLFINNNVHSSSERYISSSRFL